MTLAPSETGSAPSPPAGHGPPLRLLPRVVAVALLVLAAGFYLHGLRHSPLLWPPAAPPDSGLAANHEAGNEELLARSYWMRYRDIRLDRHWGETGAMGIAGPRHHYRQHGQREGRIFAPLVIPDDLETEAVLAESYWRRYPEVRDSWVWGEHSALGILGPRDHYLHVGRGLGYLWGSQDPPRHQEAANTANPAPATEGKMP